jgi:hypothetical protein
LKEFTVQANGPLVIAKKEDDSLRFCLDQFHLNKVIEREHCKLLTSEEITAKLGGAQIFSKLDASQAFYQVPLDESNSDLCDINFCDLHMECKSNFRWY